MKLYKLTLKDKKLFRYYLNLREHELSTYSFVNIYIWKELFTIRWTIIKDSLCVFFQDKIGCFLYLSPLAKNLNPSVIKACFKIMDSFNKNKNFSRIENVEEKDLNFYKKLGYECKEKFPDYLCKREDLVQLSGNKFKAKRALFNYFIKNYFFQYLNYTLKYKKDCLKLYDYWMKTYKIKNKDPLYQSMLKDSRISLKVVLDNCHHLGLLGRIVKIDNQIKAFTFGYKLNPKIFCILYEITDLSQKGLSQFIFRQFCLELKEYRYINIMDDSGLENLKKVKLSYRPVRLIPNFIVERKDV